MRLAEVRCREREQREQGNARWRVSCGRGEWLVSGVRVGQMAHDGGRECAVEMEVCGGGVDRDDGQREGKGNWGRRKKEKRKKERKRKKEKKKKSGKEKREK